MKRWPRFILPPAILALGAVGVLVLLKTRPPVASAPRENAAPIVRVTPLQAQDYQFVVEAQGTVTPRTEINLASEVAGRVVSVSPAFAAGGFFEAGDILLTIDARDYELVVVRARAALAQAEVGFAREQAEAEVALREWRTLGSGEPGSLLKREPQVAEVRAAVESAKAAVQQAELDLERCPIAAPFAGRVRSQQADTGQFLKKGDIVARIYAIEYAEVRLPLPLDQTEYLELPVGYRGEAGLREGPKVKLRARIGTQMQEWKGRIVRTEGEIDVKSRTITAVVRVDDPYARSTDSRRPPLAVGLFVDAEIEGKVAEKVIIAPRSSLHGPDQLTVVDKERKLRFRTIAVIRLERERLIFRGGVEEGDMVCISGIETPVDGMSVRIVESPRNVASAIISPKGQP